MRRVAISEQTKSLLAAAKKIARDAEAEAVLVLADAAHDFEQFRDTLKRTRFIVASDRDEVLRAAEADGVDRVRILHEPQTRQHQLSQALLEAISENLLESGDRVVCLYPLFERDGPDSISLVNLAVHLARLSSRDLRRLDTSVPLETLSTVVDVAVEIGAQGREGKKVGAIFVVGDHRRVLAMSHEQVHDPFKGYTRKERLMRSPRVQESVKEIAQMDGAFVISADGVVHAAGRNLNAPAEGLTLSKGLGSRHWAAAAISKQTDAVAIAVSESSGTVRIFQRGTVVLRIEPMERGMKWSELETEPPSANED